MPHKQVLGCTTLYIHSIITEHGDVISLLLNEPCITIDTCSTCYDLLHVCNKEICKKVKSSETAGTV